MSQTTITNDLFFGGMDREYIVYIPESYDGQKEFPLMFNFHGGDGYASDFIYTNDMRSIADTADFIAVYPQGAINTIEDGVQEQLHGFIKHQQITMISILLKQLLDALSLEYSIDQSRIYACGYSEGAIFSYELGCRLNHKIAAFAAVSGSMLDNYYRDDIYGWGPCTLFTQLE